MLQIIGLSGHARCGKSETLNNLKEILRSEGKSISSQPHSNSDVPETFLWKGKVVCIAPGGDNAEIVSSNINYFKQKKGEIVITATRSKGAPVWTLQDFAKEMGLQVRWFNKSHEYHLSKATQTACNQEFAEVIHQSLAVE